MSALNPLLSPEDQVQKPALTDFDELFEIHPALMRQVMAALPPCVDFTSQRAKFLALREWVMLSSAFDIPCYTCLLESRSTEVPPLWFHIGARWISEEHVDTGLFPQVNSEPVSTQPCDPQHDRLLRWHTNLWLIQIEAAFQAWWRNSPDAVVAMLRPNDNPETLQDISEQLLANQPDLRAKSVATNTYPYRGRTTTAGRVFLYMPSDELVKWRKAQQDGELLEDQTPDIEQEHLPRRI